MTMTKRSKFAPSPERTEEAGYLGPAGEHLVLAKLLMRQFDAAIVSRDTGNDIIAVKNRVLFRIQVKARTLRGRANNQAVVYVKKSVLERKDQADFYIYVMFPPEGGAEMYIIVPGKIVRDWTVAGQLPYRQNQQRFQSNIITRDGRWFIKNFSDENEVTKFVNAWNLIG